MSVPIRYSATTTTGMVNNNQIDSSVQAAEICDGQQMMIEGRFGTPGAAAATTAADVSDSIITQTNIAMATTATTITTTTTNHTTEELFAKLHEALALESKFQPMLYLPQQSKEGEITVGARDGAAHILRCLKVWYDLPTEVLFTAINLVDRFLTKMRVKPKHMACISIGSFHLAIRQLGIQPIDLDDLVAISQCGCTPGDLDRMSGIIANKLGVQMNTSPMTSLAFLRIFHAIFKNVADELDLAEFYETAISLSDLEMRLEILSCDASCASIRASELALVLICTQLDTHVTILIKEVNDQIQGLVNYAIQLQRLCRIPEEPFFNTHRIVCAILSRYNQQSRMPYRQRLVWKLSSRTMRVLRPTNKLTSYLPTIKEDISNTINGNNNLLRLRTGSVSSEEGEDWPTSPVIPVVEKC